MPSFYHPRKTTINNIPIIIYPCNGLEKVFDRTEENCLEKHINNLYKENKDLYVGQYHIIIMWNDDTDKMCDVWIFDKIESWGSGPLADEKTYRNLVRETTIGVSAGDGLIMLGRETELEEKLRKSGKGLSVYINHARAMLPIDIASVEDFYTK